MGALYHLKQRLVDFCNVIQQNVNRTDTVPSSAVVYSGLKALNDSLDAKKFISTPNAWTALTDLNIDVSAMYNAGQMVYFAPFGTTAANLPLAGSGGYLMAFIFYNATQCVEVAFTQGTLGIYMRKYVSGTWSAWSAI